MSTPKEWRKAIEEKLKNYENDPSAVHLPMPTAEMHGDRIVTRISVDLDTVERLLSAAKFEEGGTVEYLNDDENSGAVMFRDKAGREVAVMNVDDYRSLLARQVPR